MLSVQFICDLMNYCSDTYPYKLDSCTPFNDALAFEFITPPCNDIWVKYLSSAAVNEIFSLWQSGELDKDRNKPLWQIEFENYLEGS